MKVPAVATLMSLFLPELTHFDKKNFHLLHTFCLLPLLVATWQNLQSGWLYASVWAWISYELLFYSLLISLPLSFWAINNFSVHGTSCSFLHLFQCCSAVTLLFFLGSFPFLCFDNLRPFFYCSFHRTLMHVKMFTYFSLKIYIQHFTKENNFLLILLLESLYVCIMQWSLFSLTQPRNLMCPKIYVGTSAFSPSRQKVPI